MITLSFQSLEAEAQQKGCKVYEIIDQLITQQLSPMKTSPLIMNTITKEFEFIHEGEKLSAEMEYSVEINPNHDSVEVIGEISTSEGDVREIKEAVLLAGFRSRYWNEIEAIRDDLKAEKKSSLRDFGARVF